MIKLFFKSAMYYTFARKYGKKFIFILSIIGFIILIHFIYSDIIEYLTLNDMKEKLIYVLLIKWLLTLISIFTIVFIIKSSLNSKEKTDPKLKKEKEVKIVKQPISNIEKEIIEKNELKSHGDKLIEEMKQRKKNAK